MEVAVRAKPPPPKPKPKPKPNGIASATSNGDQGLAASSGSAPNPDYDATASINDAQPVLEPPRPKKAVAKPALAAAVNGNLAQDQNTAPTEAAAPKPKVVRRKVAPPADNSADKQPENGQPDTPSDARPAVKKPAAKKATANGQPRVAPSENGQASEVIAPIENGSAEKPSDAQPVKKTVKKVPARPKAPATENGQSNGDAQPQTATKVPARKKVSADGQPISATKRQPPATNENAKPSTDPSSAGADEPIATPDAEPPKPKPTVKKVVKKVPRPVNGDAPAPETANQPEVRPASEVPTEELPADAPPRPVLKKPAGPKKTVRKSMQPAPPPAGPSGLLGDMDDGPLPVRQPPVEAPPPLPDNHPLTPPPSWPEPVPVPAPEPADSQPAYQQPAVGFNQPPEYGKPQSVTGYDQLQQNRPFAVPPPGPSQAEVPAPSNFQPSTSTYQPQPMIFNAFPQPNFGSQTFQPFSPQAYQPQGQPNFVNSNENIAARFEQAPSTSNLQRSASKTSLKGVFSSLRQSFSKKSKSKDPPAGMQATPGQSELNLAGNGASMSESALLGSQQALSMGLGVSAAQLTTAKSVGALSTRTAGGAPQQCIVVMLDGDEIQFEVPRRALGVELANKVCDYLDLIERDYFGLTYTNRKFETWFWLHEDKPIAKQLGENAWVFRFQVKFYPPEPTMMKEELSRYQLCLQIRQDLYYGKLPCSWVTQALLGSYMVQSEMGDYEDSMHGGSLDYLRSFAFVNGQSDELLAKIAELHRTHRGLTPSQADMRYLENAKRLELYGIDLHNCRDVAGIEVQVGVFYGGVVVYKDRLRLNRFAWPKILKIGYKKDTLLLLIRADRFENQLINCAFRYANHKLTKRVWRYAAESHTFYRLKEPRKAQMAGTKSVTASMMSLVSLGSARGSQFRYSGRTLHQARNETLGRSGPEAPSFERLASKRSTTGSMPNLSSRMSLSLTPAQQQNNASVAARSGSMMSLMLPPPRVGSVQTSQSLEMLNSGTLGRTMTMPDGSVIDTRSQSRRDKESAKTEKEAAKREKQAAAQLAKEQREAAKREKQAAKRSKSRTSLNDPASTSEPPAQSNDGEGGEQPPPQFDAAVHEQPPQLQPSNASDYNSEAYNGAVAAQDPLPVAAPRYTKRQSRSKQAISPQTQTFDDDQIL